MCADLLGDDQGLLVRDGLHLAGAEGVGGGAVISQVELGAHQDDGDAGGVVFDLREPLHCGHVSRIGGAYTDHSPDLFKRCIGNRRDAARPSYLGFDVIEGGRADNREADQEDVGLRIG